MCTDSFFFLADKPTKIENSVTGKRVRGVGDSIKYGNVDERLFKVAKRLSSTMIDNVNALGYFLVNAAMEILPIFI